MENLSVKTLKILKIAVLLFGIVVGFIIWLQVPDMIKGSHPTDSPKTWLLLLLPIPLFALMIRKEECECHGTDMQLRKQLEEKNDKKQLMLQIVLGFICSLMVVATMLLAIGLK